LPLASARVLLASVQPSSCRPQLNQVLTKTRRHGFMGEARLALGELEEEVGQTAAAQT